MNESEMNDEITLLRKRLISSLESKRRCRADSYERALYLNGQIGKLESEVDRLKSENERLRKELEGLE